MIICFFLCFVCEVREKGKEDVGKLEINGTRRCCQRIYVVHASILIYLQRFFSDFAIYQSARRDLINICESWHATSDISPFIIAIYRNITFCRCVYTTWKRKEPEMEYVGSSNESRISLPITDESFWQRVFHFFHTQADGLVKCLATEC